ncbi:hypothetical protein AMTR_s00082p00091930 [Amborella trichopoda]|uniref:Uncharacterized protein n=1 Tax=Amborella trichopoda TaxID=13333 RepID=W1NSJ3_AMBTC|nr:hypothetical protein AMTR_s00082p00091930 [Amborella trichopoda]
MCRHMLKIAGMRAVVKEPDVACELLTNASFFTRGGPFPIGRPLDGIFIDTFSLALDKAIIEIGEAMYLWWYSTNANYWDAPHPWKVADGSRSDRRVGRCFVPPPFTVIFILDHHPDDWRKLAMPRLLSGDEDRMKLLSLRKKAQSFFDKLEMIFGLGARGMGPPQEGELASVPRAWTEGETRSGSSRQVSRAPRPSASAKSKRACRAPDSPPPALSSAPLAISRPVDSWPGWPSAGPLDSGCGLRSLTSKVEVDTILAASSPVAYPTRLAMSTPPASKATQKEVVSSRVRSSGSSTVRSLDSHASRGFVENSPLRLHSTVRVMMPPGSGPSAVNVPPLNMVDFLAALWSSPSFKVSMVRGMLRLRLQGLRGCPLLELGEWMEVFRVCVASRRSAFPDGEIFNHLDGLLQNLSD